MNEQMTGENFQDMAERTADTVRDTAFSAILTERGEKQKQEDARQQLEAQLKTTYGQVYRVALVLEPDDDTQLTKEYYFQKPSTASYDRYVKNAANGATRALNVFLGDNVVEEFRFAMEADLREYPAMVLSLGEKLMAMLGLSKTTNLKML